MLRELLTLTRAYLTDDQPGPAQRALRSALYRWAEGDDNLIREATQFLLRCGMRRMNPDLRKRMRELERAG